MNPWRNCRTVPPPLYEPVMFRDRNLVSLPSSWAQFYAYGIGRRCVMELDGGGKVLYYEIAGHVFRAVDVPPGLEWREMAIG